MEKIKKITIAAPTYGNLPRVNFWIQSVWNNLEPGPEVDLDILVVDDGTPDKQVVENRSRYCGKFNVNFAANERNLGIPGAWNRIFRWAENHGSDLVLCCNDDVRFLAPGWLARILYVFNNNDAIGGVGLPLVNEGGLKMDDPRWDGEPGRVGAAIGCVFAMRPEVLFKVENPDGKNGFWESLRAFHEEVHAGFSLARLGYYSLMLPWPPLRHMGGATFQANQELIWMDLPDYLTKEEFLSYVRSLPWYVKGYEENYQKGRFDRMSMSRCMFTKYWGILGMERMQEIPGQGIVDIWAEPQKWVHSQVVTPMPPKELKWLDRNGTQRVTVI